MFQFPRCPPHSLSYGVTVHNHCRVPPFGYLRVTGCLHLSVAYRSLPRPSSADIAKASTVRPYYLYLFCVIICAYRRRLTLDFALRTTVRGGLSRSGS